MTAPFPSIVPGLVISIVVPESNIYDECDRFISPPEEISFLSAPKKIIQIYIINKFFKTVIDILIYMVYKYN